MTINTDVQSRIAYFKVLPEEKVALLGTMGFFAIYNFNKNIEIYDILTFGNNSDVTFDSFDVTKSDPHSLLVVSFRIQEPQKSKKDDHMVMTNIIKTESRIAVYSFNSEYQNNLSLLAIIEEPGVEISNAVSFQFHFNSLHLVCTIQGIYVFDGVSKLKLVHLFEKNYGLSTARDRKICFGEQSLIIQDANDYFQIVKLVRD